MQRATRCAVAGVWCVRFNDGCRHCPPHTCAVTMLSTPQCCGVIHVCIIRAFRVFMHHSHGEHCDCCRSSGLSFICVTCVTCSQIDHPPAASSVYLHTVCSGCSGCRLVSLLSSACLCLFSALIVNAEVDSLHVGGITASCCLVPAVVRRMCQRLQVMQPNTY
jgi:hypothetical protein